MAENTNKLGEMTKSSLESIRNLLDANTIVGDPIETASGTCIIPISKISVGFGGGGHSVFCGLHAAQNDDAVGGGGLVPPGVTDCGDGTDHRIDCDRRKQHGGPFQQFFHKTFK